ncbi:MAG: hypothetical protein OMM_10496 [Candidatus Magnetoglobus multicellularis str. Araruama]|uniref:Uncharacterized protein n=1 Tax=Candidatus Magnetoglobus multicellularis str. Araruama TaxID=890399 RepID=A0A1V1P0S6_9BACT|nr:MAG: hypothetical protein OMM_10496 [Candidatus Magnetoglobus multicellularis str. Araruama]
MSFIIEGTDCLPPLSGGYLIINIDKKEFHIVSVPSPVLSADRHRDSVNENSDFIEDEEGNEFSITVLSSNVGVDWTIEVKTKSDEKELRKRIGVEYQANEF